MPDPLVGQDSQPPASPRPSPPAARAGTPRLEAPDLRVARPARRRRPLLARRPAPPRRRFRPAGLRPGLATSVLLHLAFAALIVIAALQRERPPEPLPPPSYAVYYESGAPERPAEPEAVPSPPPSEAAPPLPAPPPVAPAPPATAPPLTAPPPPAIPQLASPPTPRSLPTPAPPVPPPPAPPRPQDTAELLPDAPLPLPPPAAPPAPPRERPQTPPPPSATAQRPAQRLPGLYLPEGLNVAPPQQQAAPRAARPDAQRAPLDLSLDRLAVIGRASPEPRADVRGAEVGPDWRSAFRRWLEENKRYPENARVVGEQGTNRVQIIAGPDGRVRSARLLRQSGSVWLDAGTVGLFRGATLPAFPPGADPNGVTIDLTINYILVYR